MAMAGVRLSDTQVKAIKNNTAPTWSSWNAKSSSRVVRKQRAPMGSLGGSVYSQAEDLTDGWHSIAEE